MLLLQPGCHAPGEAEAASEQPNIVFVLAKLWIWLRTTAMPLSSDAFNSKTIEPNSLGEYSCRATARIVLVFPVPGGP